MAKENREYKDSVFRDLFHTDEKARENLLELYNALYDTDYTNPELIHYIGLEDILFKDFVHNSGDISSFCRKIVNLYRPRKTAFKNIIV